MRSPKLLLPAVLAALAGCAATPEHASPSTGTPLGAALATLGSATFVAGTGEGEVVILKDRHAVGPGIFYVDEDLRAFQREQHAVVSHLVARGFTLLGCEHDLGPLPRNQAAADNIAVIERARAEHDDLDRWSVFQPLRYEVEFEGRLQVLGVEDPALYGQDLDTLDQIEKTRRAASFHDAGGPSPQALAREEVRLLGKIRANVAARGAAAGVNLLAAMKERGATKAILMLGAAHVPAASAALKAAGVGHWIFETPSFGRRTG
jgi:hypothetical protein